MKWPDTFVQQVQSNRTNLKTLNDRALDYQYIQCFRLPACHLTRDRKEFLIAMKMAADTLRRVKNPSIPPDVVAMLSLHKER